MRIKQQGLKRIPLPHMRGFKTCTALPTTGTQKLLKITHYSPSTLVDLVILDKPRCAGWCCDLPPTSPCRDTQPVVRGAPGQRDMHLRGCRELPPRWALQHPQTGISPPELLEMPSLELSLPKLCDFPVLAHSRPPSPAAPRYAGRACTRRDAAGLSQATTGTTATSLKRG